MAATPAAPARATSATRSGVDPPSARTGTPTAHAARSRPARRSLSACRGRLARRRVDRPEGDVVGAGPPLPLDLRDVSGSSGRAGGHRPSRRRASDGGEAGGGQVDAGEVGGEGDVHAAVDQDRDRGAGQGVPGAQASASSSRSPSSLRRICTASTPARASSPASARTGCRGGRPAAVIAISRIRPAGRGGVTSCAGRGGSGRGSPRSGGRDRSR